MATKKIQNTENYRLFVRHEGENRPLNMQKHRRLMKSMKQYGFLPEFPIVVYRNGNNQLVIKDGQHRYACAESLGLPIHYVETDKDWDVATINSTAITWKLIDYAQKHAANGLKDYQTAIDFADKHQLPIGIAVSILIGTVSFKHYVQQFLDGKFKIKNMDFAELVVSVYVPLTKLSSEIKNTRFIEACMAVCRVKDFDPKRLLENAERCREKLVPYSTRDAYLEMLEDIYNYRRVKLIGLKTEAIMAMRARNIGLKNRNGDKHDEDES